MTYSKSRTLTRDSVLALIQAGAPITMLDLVMRMYGHSDEAFVCRVRSQISTLRTDGHDVVYDRKTGTYSLRPAA